MDSGRAKLVAEEFGLELFYDYSVDCWGLRLPGEVGPENAVWIAPRLLHEIGSRDFRQHYVGEVLRRGEAPEED